MSIRNYILLPLALLRTADADEPSPERPTPAEFSIFVVADRPWISGTVCSAKAPAMRRDFDQAIAIWRSRVEKVANALLATEDFAALKHEPAPRALVDNYNQEFESQKAKYKDIDPITDCPKILENIRGAGDKELEDAVTKVLTGMKSVVALAKVGVIE